MDRYIGLDVHQTSTTLAIVARAAGDLVLRCWTRMRRR
jgi:hypothetical protein